MVRVEVLARSRVTGGVSDGAGWWYDLRHLRERWYDTRRAGDAESVRWSERVAGSVRFDAALRQAWAGVKRLKLFAGRHSPIKPV